MKPHLKYFGINEADGFFKFPVLNREYYFYHHKNSINIFVGAAANIKYLFTNYTKADFCAWINLNQNFRIFNLPDKCRYFA